MTIESTQNPDKQTSPAGVSSAFVDALLRQLSPEEKAILIDKHLNETLPVVVEDKPENKLAGLNYQDHGLNISEFTFIVEYLGNGFNATISKINKAANMHTTT